MQASQAEAYRRAGVAALQRGDGREARRLLEIVAAAGPPIAPPWMLLAEACRLCGDRAGEEKALDALLLIEPRHLGGLLMKAELRASLEDESTAARFYQLAIGVANNTQVPDHLVPRLRRAESVLAANQRKYEEHLRGELAAKGASPDAMGDRFRDAIDLLTGRKQLYLQQPTSFYFPGLPQRQFYERSEFAWLDAVERELPAIQAELRAELARDRTDFAPHVRQQPDMPPNPNPLLDDPRWSSLYLWDYGVAAPDVQARFPRTMAALEQAPLPMIAGRGPLVMFSLLRAGAHIVPHHGAYNTRLICHLPLFVPGGCRFRVGNETRAWEEGKTLIFDDSIEHEAWNQGDGDRIILLFDIWRPELTATERQAVTALFQTIEAYWPD